MVLFHLVVFSDFVVLLLLVDFVDFYLNSGKLKRTSNSGTRSELIEQVESASCVSEPICDRDKLLIYGAALAPEFQIQQ